MGSWTIGSGGLASLSIIVVFIIVLVVVSPFIGRAAGIEPVPNVMSWQWIGIAALMVVFIAIIGKSVNGRWTGILIDERKVMTLSRIQMIIWTVIIISAYITMVSARSFAGRDPFTIEIDQQLWALLGISSASLVGTPIIMNSKKGKKIDRDKEANKLRTIAARDAPRAAAQAAQAAKATAEQAAQASPAAPAAAPAAAQAAAQAAAAAAQAAAAQAAQAAQAATPAAQAAAAQAAAAQAAQAAQAEAAAQAAAQTAQAAAPPVQAAAAAAQAAQAKAQAAQAKAAFYAAQAAQATTPAAAAQAAAAQAAQAAQDAQDAQAAAAAQAAQAAAPPVQAAAAQAAQAAAAAQAAQGAAAAQAAAQAAAAAAQAAAAQAAAAQAAAQGKQISDIVKKIDTGASLSGGEVIADIQIRESVIEDHAMGTAFVYNDNKEAKFTDIFEGDEIGNESLVDLSKVQMFFFTIIAALGYVVLLFNIFAGPDVPDRFPPLSNGLIAILAISHATYLTNKSVDHTATTP